MDIDDHIFENIRSIYDYTDASIYLAAMGL